MPLKGYGSFEDQLTTAFVSWNGSVGWRTIASFVSPTRSVEVLARNLGCLRALPGHINTLPRRSGAETPVVEISAAQGAGR